MTDIRVLIVDDQQLVREGIASLLDIQEGVSVIGTAADGQQAVNQAAKQRPDVILMDIRMPKMDGIQATERIQVILPDCKILMLTTFDDEEYIVRSLRAGANGYLLKDIPVAELAQAVRLTYAGISQLAPSIAGMLIDRLTPASSDQRPEDIPTSLTDRELQVLRLLGTGASNKEIAQELYLSEGTVKNHVSSILSQLGLRDRVQAALYAIRHGLG